MFIKIVQLVFLGATHLPFLFPLFPPIFRQMNDTWKQTDPTIKKKKSAWKNTTVAYLPLPFLSGSPLTMQLCNITTPLCNYAASQHQTKNVEHKWKAQNRPY